MGVHGLQAYVEAKYGSALTDIRKIAASVGERATLCVDGSGLLYWLWEYPHRLNWILGGQYQRYAERVVQFVQAFRNIGIELVVFIDGLALPMKRATMLSRRKMSAMKVSTAFEFVQMNKKMDNPFNDPILPVLSTRVLVDALKCMGAKVFFANYEGDRAIAQYAATHQECIGVLGRDSDFLVFDLGPNKHYFCIKTLQFRCDKQHKCQVLARSFNVDTTAQLLGFHKKWLPLFGALVGNDYTRDDIYAVRQHLANSKDGLFPIIDQLAAFFAKQHDTDSEQVIGRILKPISSAEQRRIHEALIRESLEAYRIHESWDEFLKEKNNLELILDSGVNELLMIRFKLARFFPSLIGVLHNSEYWCSIVLTDHSTFRDPYKLYKTVRKRMYIVLLGVEAEKRKAQKEEKLKMKEARRLAMHPNGDAPHGDAADASPNTTSNSKTRRKKRREKTMDVKIFVDEIRQTEYDYLAKAPVQLLWPHDSTKPTDTSEAQGNSKVWKLPSAAELFDTSSSSELRRSTFLCLMNSNCAPFLHAQGDESIPASYIFPCASLRQLLTQCDEDPEPTEADIGNGSLPPPCFSIRRNPVFREWEFDALLLHTILMQQTHAKTSAQAMGTDLSALLDLEAAKEPAPFIFPKSLEANDRKRLICLGVLYQVGLQHALMAHELCNDPWEAELLSSWTYFDGRGWADLYVEEWRCHRALTQASTPPPQPKRRAPGSRKRARRRGGVQQHRPPRTHKPTPATTGMNQDDGEKGPQECSADAAGADESQAKQARWRRRFGDQVVELHGRLKAGILFGLLDQTNRDSLWRPPT